MYHHSIALPQHQAGYNMNMGSPGTMSPNPYNFDDLDKVSILTNFKSDVEFL
jgi:hypothetical protein